MISELKKVSLDALQLQPAPPTNSLAAPENIEKTFDKLSELKIIKEQAEGKLPSADNDKQKQQLQLEIKIPGNLLEYVQISFGGKVDYPFVDMEYSCVANYLNMEISWDAGFGTLVIAKMEVRQLERLKNNSEENSRSSDISEDQQAQNRLEVEITEKFIQYVRIYYNEKIDESIHALSIETVGPVSSTAPLAEHMEETIDKVLQQ
ncbi:unnamed protein product [Adineta steineri]|uniref:Uncharacterized protein n=1 Tax=Adineta steineri TaxID=433720 RepID=A0A814A4R6_9BILA|nr:unnamed protein product [Adineta steineri]CAF0907586.1 unnamed protein product [Adineta steineri]